jgi:dCTP deaminase
MAEEQKMIDPFLPELVRETNGSRIISAGASSYGYDMRLADDGFRIFSSVYGLEIDPKHFDENSLIEPALYTAEDDSKYYLLPPHHYGLGVTVETFQMPRNVTGIALGKSTYARAGLLVNTTPLEAGWTGRLVVEIWQTCPCASTSTKASVRFFSSNPTNPAPSPIQTEAESIKDRQD